MKKIAPEEIVLFNATPSLIVVGFGIVGFIFMSAICYLIYSSNNFSEIYSLEQGQHLETFILLSLCFLLFGGFALMSLTMVFNIKFITLTNKRIVMRKPLLLYKKGFYISDIELIDIKKKEVNNRKLGGLYSGEKTTILFKNKKRISYESIELYGYIQLNSMIGRIQRCPKAELYKIKPETEISRWLMIKAIIQFFGSNGELGRNTLAKMFFLLFFIAALTIGLIYALLGQSDC